MSAPDLSDLPHNMTLLPVHLKMGLPIPVINTFGWQDFDFTTVDGATALKLAQRKLCGICGKRFELAAFLGGPKSAEARTYTDPPMHEDCAEAAVRLCPHIARKNMRRATDAHVRQDAITPESMTLAKPDQWVMYVSDTYKIFIAGEGDQRHAVYEPQENIYVRTWEYSDQGQLEEI
jgi:hypothetical protein